MTSSSPDIQNMLTVSDLLIPFSSPPYPEPSQVAASTNAC